MGDSDTLALIRPDPKAKRLSPDDGLEETVASGNTFATTRGLRAPPALRFFHSDGRLKFAMPYGYLPIVWGESSRAIVIEYPGFFTMVLAGKNLGDLETRLCDYRVTWIRECDEAQASLLPVAVTRIERLASFPSREAGKDTSGNA